MRKLPQRDRTQPLKVRGLKYVLKRERAEFRIEGAYDNFCLETTKEILTWMKDNLTPKQMSMLGFALSHKYPQKESPDADK